jgi:dTDP-4-dehydrorhamnose reductase
VRILITGASGFVGSQLGRHLSREHDVLGIVFRNQRCLPFRFESVDLTAGKAVAALLQEFKPRVIVHAAAMSRVLDCEDHPEEAAGMNVGVTEVLAIAAKNAHARMIFLSSDQVFSGGKGGYRESHTPDPANVYGRTKLEAEQAVLASGAVALIVRSNSVVGPSIGWGESFTDMVLRKLRNRQTLTLFEDQYRSPIHIRTMVRVLEAACVMEFSGLLHVGGSRRLNRLDTGYAVARAYGLSPDPIVPASYSTHPRASIMTADNSYDISRLRQLMPFIEFKPLDEELAQDAQESRIP